eukprot:334036_1
MSRYQSFALFAAAVKTNMSHKGQDLYRSTKNIVMVLHWWSMKDEERGVYSEWILENANKDDTDLSPIPQIAKPSTIKNYLNYYKTDRWEKNVVFLIALLRGINEHEQNVVHEPHILPYVKSREGEPAPPVSSGTRKRGRERPSNPGRGGQSDAGKEERAQQVL